MNGTIFMAIAIVLPVILLTVFVIIRNQRRARQQETLLYSWLNGLLQADGATAGTQDILSDRIIALGADGRFLYLAGTGAEDVQERIPVSGITGSKIVKTSIMVAGTTRGKTEEHIQKIGLELTVTGRGTVHLPFYDEIRDGGLELLRLKELAEKWQRLLSAPVTAPAHS